MRFLKIFFLTVATLVVVVSTSPADEYWIKIVPKAIKGFLVRADIETNLPGPVMLAARLAFKEAKPQDPFIGTGYIRVPLTNGKGQATIDGEKDATPRGLKLPNGKYDIEVAYNHLWPENTATTVATKIGENFRGFAAITLPGTESAPPDATSSAEDTRWVMENVYNGYAWDPEFWRKRFGEMEKLDYQGLGDGKTLKIYYIKSLNMTLIVNEPNNFIVGYRMGRVQK